MTESKVRPIYTRFSFESDKGQFAERCSWPLPAGSKVEINLQPTYIIFSLRGRNWCCVCIISTYALTTGFGRVLQSDSLSIVTTVNLQSAAADRSLRGRGSAKRLHNFDIVATLLVSIKKRPEGSESETVSLSVSSDLYLCSSFYFWKDIIILVGAFKRKWLTYVKALRCCFLRIERNQFR